MKITKGSLEYHISYGLHSNIKGCCITAWIADTSYDEIGRRITLCDSRCHYVPCDSCIVAKTYNKIVECSKHKRRCCFIPKGRDWRKGPPQRITLPKYLQKAVEKFKKEYGF